MHMIPFLFFLVFAFERAESVIRALQKKIYLFKNPFCDSGGAKHVAPTPRARLREVIRAPEQNEQEAELPVRAFCDSADIRPVSQVPNAPIQTQPSRSLFSPFSLSLAILLLLFKLFFFWG